MIHHVSISARQPQHVAEVLAEIMHGRCHPFPGGVAESFMAISGDEHGTLVEVYPDDTTLSPGEGDAPARGLRGQAPLPTCPFHFLLSVPASREDIERIGAREGWRTKLFGRGAPGQKPFFHVIEFWVENRLMIEVAPSDMIGEYTQLMRSETMQSALAPMPARQRADE